MNDQTQQDKSPLHDEQMPASTSNVKAKLVNRFVGAHYILR